MTGTIFTVATIQRYDSESQKKGTEGVCALYMWESETVVVNLELYIYSDFLYILSRVVKCLDVL